MLSRVDFDRGARRSRSDEQNLEFVEIIRCPTLKNVEGSLIYKIHGLLFSLLIDFKMEPHII